MTLEDFFDFDSAKARVFLQREGDQKYMALLSDSVLLVIYKGKRHLFQTESIRQIITEDKRLLFPLILGGILAPFAFVSSFLHPMQPWMHLVAIISGLWLLYIGWTGKPALVVVLKNKEEVIFYLSAISANLRAFLDFANASFSQRNNQPYTSLIYVEWQHEIDSLFTPDQQKSELFPCYGFTYSQLPERKESEKIHIAFDPVTSGREIRFEYDAATKLFRPVIDGPLRPECRVEIPSSIM